MRVREALALALDFEWMNRQLFFNAYTRVRGYFVASDFEAKDMPGVDELALLQPWQQRLPAAVFTQPAPLPPVTSLNPDSGHTLRDHLRRAKALLAAAGWHYRDGALRNAQGQPFTIEFLDNSGSMGRVVTPLSKNLEKLGIQVQYKVVDFAILQKRLDVFDFEVISNRYVGSEAPYTDLLERFGSKAAQTVGSGNLIGARPGGGRAAGSCHHGQNAPGAGGGIARAGPRIAPRALQHPALVRQCPPRGVPRRQVCAARRGVSRYYQPEAWVLST